jgi:hypothetical protein
MKFRVNGTAYRPGAWGPGPSADWVPQRFGRATQHREAKQRALYNRRDALQIESGIRENGNHGNTQERDNQTPELARNETGA